MNSSILKKACGCHVHRTCLLLAGVAAISALLVANLAINNAWAEKGAKDEKGKGHEKTEKSQAKEASKQSGGINGSEDGNSKSGGNDKTQEIEKAPSPPPQQSPPQGNSSSNTGKAEDPSTPASSAPAPQDTSSQPPPLSKTPEPVSLPPPPPSTITEKPVVDAVGVNDVIGKASASHARSISDLLRMGDSGNNGSTSQSISVKKVVAPILAGSELRIADQISATGVISSVPSAPKITVTSPPILQVSSDQKAEINFDSTASGKYSIIFTADSDQHYSQTIEGQLHAGPNSASWDGRKNSGDLVPQGKYLYYITAIGDGGTRQPPQDGDGQILVFAPDAALSQGPLTANSNIVIPLVILIAIVIGLGIFVVTRRKKKSLILYVPTTSESIFDDLKQAFPEASIGDYYFERTSEGPQQYLSIAFPAPKDGDEEWETDVIERVKGISGPDSVVLGS